MKRILQLAVVALALTSAVGVASANADVYMTINSPPTSTSNAGSPTVGIGGPGTCQGTRIYTYSYPYIYYGSYCRELNWGNRWYLRGWHVWNWSATQYLGFWECAQAYGLPERCYWGPWNPY